MKALKYTAEFDPKPGLKLSEDDLKDKRGRQNSDKIFRHPRAELIDTPEPRIALPDEVLIKVKACGICGTDVHLLETDEDGYTLYPGHMKGNEIMGHEFCGEIVETGPGVRALKVGDKVTVEEMNWCGVCNNCRNGFPNQCSYLEEFGITMDGGFAEYVVSREQYCWNINGFADVYDTESKVWDAGCLCEPSSVAYNAVIECGGGFRPGAYVVVFGCGPIGLFSISHCKNQGAAKIIVFEIIKERIDLAKEYGADYVFNPEELKGKEPYEVIMDLTGGAGADVFVEASGVAEVTFPQIENSLAAGATLMNTAMGKERVPIYLVPFANKKGRITANIGHSGYGNFMNVIRLICARKFDPTKVITGRFPLENVLEAIDAAKKRAGGKVIIEINR